MINPNARLTKSQVKAICAKAKKQIHPLTPESKMFFAIFEMAMLDHYCTTLKPSSNRSSSSCQVSAEGRRSAAEYLMNMADADLSAIGIDSDWVARLINQNSISGTGTGRYTPSGADLP